MKCGLIITGGRMDMTFAGDFLRRHEAERGGERAGAAVRGTESSEERAGAAARGAEREPEGAGTSCDSPEAGKWTAGYDCVVCVDAGLERADALGLKPTAIVGDFDTVDPEILARYRRSQGILWDVHRPEKDETDTELAIHTAVKLGCGRLEILGATGGRLDHELSNIHLLKMCLDEGVDAVLCDAWNRVSLVAGRRVFDRESVYGKYVSFIPLTEQVKGIWLTGFKYPLSGKDISIGREAGLCVSNEIAEETAEIRISEGILICIESKD